MNKTLAPWIEEDVFPALTVLCGVVSAIRPQHLPYSTND
jgi:hypothetical protein